MDYGERQQQALFLISVLRKDPSIPIPIGIANPNFPKTYGEMATEIENQSTVGKELMAVAGMVISAIMSNSKVQAYGPR